jgi:1-acyl-sn-glycerol-3-phosphate acyltransferase
MLSFSTVMPGGADVRYFTGATAIVLSGLFGAGVIASYLSLLQRIVPNRVRGRIFGLADLFAMGALLLATGALGIPEWKELDRWVGLVLLVVALIAGATGLVSLLVRLRSGRFRSVVGFWWNVIEFYARWWCRLKREGICTVPSEGPVIVVANHTSSVDPLLLIASSPYRVLSFMIAVEFSKVPIGRYLTELVECIPVNRTGYDAGATKAALRHLKAGMALGIFIEGRIGEPGQILEPKDGPALLAMRTGALIVPAFIWGTRYHDSVFMGHVIRHHGRVRYGKPIDVRALAAGRDDKETLHAISRHILHKVRELAPPDLPHHPNNLPPEHIPPPLEG